MILSASEKPSANLKISFLRPAGQNSIMPDAHKSSWRNMHQESSDEFNSGKRKFLPFSFISIILDCKYYFLIPDSFDSVIADSNTMGIFAEIIDNGLRAVKSFLAVRLPFF